MSVALLAAILSSLSAHAQLGKLRLNVDKAKNAAGQAQDAGPKTEDVPMNEASTEVNRKTGKETAIMTT